MTFIYQYCEHCDQGSMRPLVERRTECASCGGKYSHEGERTAEELDREMDEVQSAIEDHLRSLIPEYASYLVVLYDGKSCRISANTDQEAEILEAAKETIETSAPTTRVFDVH